jgi:cell division septation protein DedD
VAPGNPPPSGAGNGTLPNTEPRKIRTLAVKGDQPDGSALPASSAPPAAAKQAPGTRTAVPPATPHNPPTSANASANAPLSLVPQANQAAPAPAAAPNPRMANTNPVQTAPSGGEYLVQVSSQKSEADAQASFRALQSKFPSVLGSQTPLIRKADAGEKGVVYRAMVGPFGSRDEAIQFCGNLKSAGGQCFVPRN